MDLISLHYLPSGFFYSQCSESVGEIYILSLQILANLCRGNVSVQAFMKGLVRLYCMYVRTYTVARSYVLLN